jgi:hypothetical protein
VKLSTILLIFIVFSVAFVDHDGYAAPVVVSGGSDNDYESWIARLADGRLMVIFDRNPDWVSGDLYATFSTDDGNTWSAPAPVIVEAGDQATMSFVPMPDDTIRLWYASNESGTYGIYAAFSTDGLAWTKTGRINLGWSVSDMHYDPTVILEPDSSLTMSYRGPNGAFVSHCPYRGAWDTLKTMAAQSGFRPRIMKHADGTYLIAYHRKSGTGSTNYDVFVRTSIDRVTWSDSIRLTTNLNSHDPFCGPGPDGAYVVYYGKYVSPAYNLKRRKSFDAVNWQVEESITADVVYNLQPHFFCENNSIYLVWSHAIDYSTDNDVYFEKTPYLGISEVNPDRAVFDRITIKPNPCPGRAEIVINGVNTPEGDINLYILTGQRIGRAIKSGLKYLIDARVFPNGVYFAEVKCGGTRAVKKFIVQH